jgi:hypothetical protein
VGPLSDDEVVKAIARQCVPVALNRELISKEKSASGDLYRAIQKQRPKQYQGIYVVDPDGNVLSNHGHTPEDRSRWTKEVRDQIDAGVRAYGGVTRRPTAKFTALNDRGEGKRADGSIVLAVTVRHLLQGLDRRGIGVPSHDSIALTAEQRAPLGRAEAEAGQMWKVPATTVQRLHKVLSPDSDPNTLPRADEVTFARLLCKVERVSKGVAYLRYTGRIAGTHVWEFPPHKGKESHAEVNFTGVGTCDAETGELRSIILVGAGAYRSVPPYDQVSKYGAVVEWKAKP